MQIGIIVETAAAREVTHFALLYAYGASSVNPYLAFAAIDDLVNRGEIQLDYSEARHNYIKSIDKGLLKVLSKMGISTLRSYQGCQNFEALGISDEIISKYFTGTSSKFGGIGFDEICQESLLFHKEAFRKRKITGNPIFESAGTYHYRKYGEHHAWNPETIGIVAMGYPHQRL